ncbi:uncharacterized protein LOC111249185 isoform X2 [Varroa destructor]|uniref:Phosphoenolpyruvate synthase n=1 Tax=Varroa destructor TaxID=109461 RepID=A0A7M7JX70_VARDE|nr:uncharacterized protein LOC111249185 isoform X2 [Varroa destructor]
MSNCSSFQCIFRITLLVVIVIQRKSTPYTQNMNGARRDLPEIYPRLIIIYIIVYILKRRDWQHVFGVDRSRGDFVQVFFERVPDGFAIVWARVKFGGRNLVLHERCYKDHSNAITRVYSAGGVRLECHGPLRFWRVAINAVMIDTNLAQANSKDRVHVKLGARISSMSHPFELPKQCSPSMLARRYEVELEEHSNHEKAKFCIAECCHNIQAYIQSGSWFCELTLDGERNELLLFGSRLKLLGKSNLLQGIRHYCGYGANGTVFHLMESTGGKCYGYCFHPTFFGGPIFKGRFQRSSAQNLSLVSFTFNTVYRSRNYPHTIYVSPKGQSADISTLNATALDAWSVSDFEGKLTRGTAEEHSVYGVTFKISGAYVLPPEKLITNALLEDSMCEGTQILNIMEEACRRPDLTGGKGSSLAVLASISQYLHENNEKAIAFSVPWAIVLTTEAYKTFVVLPEVTGAITELQKALDDWTYSTDLSCLTSASKRCVAKITKVGMPVSLEQLLLEKLKQSFEDEWENRRFAVRSSAVEEDSEEMSAAGQMSTFLGISGRKNLLDAIVKCWASQFSLSAIIYKQQYGQSLNTPMAVVVQEMARAESAGVMLTCDPVSCHPDRIVITGNFGLGESVVSAAIEPDTYTLKYAPLVGATNGQYPSVELLDKVCGKKDRMIVESNNGKGVAEMTVSSDKMQTYCLTDEQTIRLAAIGVKLTELTDTPRDIEWAIVNGDVVLLQSRPVTSVFRESDFEIQHDLNSFVCTNQEIFARGNLDEISPGVMSPMCIVILNHIYLDVFGKIWANDLFPGLLEPTPYAQCICSNIGKRNFINFSHNPLGRTESGQETLQYTLYGFDLNKDEEMKKGIFYEKNFSKNDMLKMGTFLLKTLCNIKAVVRRAENYSEHAKIEVSQHNDSLSILLSTVRQLFHVKDSMELLNLCVLPSTMLNTLILNIIKKSQGEKEASAESMVLLSKLLRSNYEVESAEIPKELMKLASDIRNEPRAAGFMDMTPDDAVKFLTTDDCEVAKKFRTFQARHGHRCYKELDVLSKTWDIDPTPLIYTLQANVRAGAIKNTERESFTVDDLERQPTFVQRKMLHYLIPRAQYAIYAREVGKSCLVKCIHQIRLALRRLGQQLQAEGRIPDAQLVFFLTVDEAYRLITTRNPSLLSRTIRRRRLHEQLDKLKVKVISSGIPKPIGLDVVSIPKGATSLPGMPVSEGVVVGVARIVTHFQTEAHLICKGDILVTRATDTGWTPYFPLLAGVVTEIGGTLSHGAVVAREYGLPAVAGVLGATEFFQSGEIITLDGIKGLVAKGHSSVNSPSGGV